MHARDQESYSTPIGLKFVNKVIVHVIALGTTNTFITKGGTTTTTTTCRSRDYATFCTGCHSFLNSMKTPHQEFALDCYLVGCKRLHGNSD